jgi:hypothetical protein
VCGQGLEHNFRLIELCCHSHTVLHQHLKLVDILLEAIMLCQYFSCHAKWGISSLGLEIFEELQTFLNLQATSRQWTQLLGSSITHVVLCLADIDLQNVGGWVGSKMIHEGT